MKHKIAFFEIENWESKYIEQNLKNSYLYFSKHKLNALNAQKFQDFDIISPFIYSKINKQILESLKSAQYITTRSTGFDHIDIYECAKKNIKVSNVPTYGENTVAEHAFALILTLAKNLYKSISRTKQGNFSLQHLRGFDLKDKTIGVIGVGNIGKYVIKIANGFNMKILAYDICQDKEFAKKYKFKYANLNYVLSHSDIITLHLPYNEHTHHLINLNTLKYFKKGCYLINTSRGKICDTTALLKGLQKGIFAGIGLDVLEEEQAIKEEKELLSPEFRQKYDTKTILENHILLNQDNVIITPHNAFNTEQALIRILDVTIKNIKHFIAHKPINLIRQTNQNVK